MALMLDRRQRAMLAEMGVRVWLPLPEAAAPVAAVADAIAPAAEPVVAPVPTPVPAPVPEPEPIRPRPPAPVATPAAFAATDTGLQPLPLLQGQSLPQLQQLADSCKGCELHRTRQHSVWDATPIPAEGPRWLFVIDVPGAAENASGQPAQGDTGKLLQQMLAALRLPAAQVHGRVVRRLLALPQIDLSALNDTGLSADAFALQNKNTDIAELIAAERKRRGLRPPAMKVTID